MFSIEVHYEGEDWYDPTFGGKTYETKKATTYDAGMLRVTNSGLKVRVVKVKAKVK